MPARAEEGPTVIANPVATSTGSVNNSAVQINQGGYSTQSYEKGHSCNGPTLVFSNYYLGSDTHPDQYHRSQGYGGQISVSIPLDGSTLEPCKELARQKVEKERFDIAILRAIKCAELMKTGYMIKPDSPMAPLCADIVNIKAYEESLKPPKPEPKPEPELPIWQQYPDLVNNDLSDAS